MSKGLKDLLILVAIMIIAGTIGANLPGAGERRSPLFGDAEMQTQETVNKIVSGQEVSFDELKLLWIRGQFFRVGEKWCDNHNIPKEERHAKISKLVENMINLKIRVTLPDQVDGEPSS